jgi:alanine-glyoxylate transaminase/serine-glyoxylate transaminase/serine-pyruvate transaminase
MSFSPLNPPRRLLFGPGPSPVHPRVYEAMSKPIVGHLDAYFFDVVEDIRKLLAEAYGTTNFFTMAISGTGSAGMETCVSNFVEPGSRFAVFANGFFCDRLSEMGKRNGAEVIRFEKPWGETFSDEEAAEFIHREKPHTVAFVHAETSTGVEQKGKAICQAAREVDALVIADCVTSLGAIPINLDDTGIDIAYSCSQKGLGCPPGLSPITVNERAMERRRARKTASPVWYFDLKLLDEYFDGAKRYHHTAPITMFYALREALLVMHEEGLANRFERHQRNHLAFVAGLEAMGLTMHVAEGKRLWTLNTPRVPEGITDMAIRKRLLDEEGIEIAGGFGQLAGKVFRIGTMGYGSREENILLLLTALERAFRAEGFAVKESGRAVAESMFATV